MRFRSDATGVNDRAASRTQTRGASLVLSAAVVFSVVLLAAGCGGSKPRASVASLGTTTTTAATTPVGTGSAGNAVGSGPQTASGGSAAGGQLRMVGGSVAQLTKFSACMRKNGVPSFPDPNAQGQISISSAAGIDPGSAQFQQAQQACQKDMPSTGAPPSPAEEQQARSQALAFSACMRSHGEPNFPDPQFGTGGRVSIKLSAGAGLDPQSPQFQRAQSACQKDLPGKFGPPSGAAASKTSSSGSSSG